ncbi:MAG: type 1 glutamine amidotransferase [Pseudomonadota bacterium]
MARRILVVEGDTPELALARRRATGGTAARRYAATLAQIDPSLSFDFAQPYFSDYAPDAFDAATYDGVVVTGSGVAWSGADEQARPFWNLFEAAFAAGAPCFGSCWGMQTAAVVLGGETAAGPNGVEAGIARALSPASHPMMEGRRALFDAICMHRDDVTRAPDGAVVTATNDHTAIQAMAYDKGDVSFWGVQYHPECDLKDAAHWLAAARDGADKAMAADLKLIAEDPIVYARLSAKREVGLDILDRDYHVTELRNWLTKKVAS